MAGVRIDQLPIATEAQLADATVDYVLAVVNGVTKLVPTSLLGGPAAPDTTAPAVPTGLALEVGDTELYASWDANTEPDLDHYDYRVDGGTAVQVAATSTTIPALVNGVEYDVEIRAVDTSANASAWSAVVSATPDVPPAASVIDASVGFANKVVIPGTTAGTWNASDDPTIIYLHGAGSSAAISTGANDLGDMLRAICQKLNRPIYVDYEAAGGWGNAASVTNLTDDLPGNVAAHMGTDPDRVIFIGGSAGGARAAAWTKANPTKVVGFIGLGPVSDLADIVANNRGGHAAAVNTAYGGTYVEATHGADHNPVTIAAAGTFDTIPVKHWYGKYDTICVPATVEAFLADCPLSTSQRHEGAHNAEIAPSLASDIAAWCRGVMYGPTSGATVAIVGGDLVTYFDRDGIYEAPSYPVDVDVLVVAGGGSGGTAYAAGAYYSGGGSAGEVVTDTVTITGPTDVFVGRGGCAAGPDSIGDTRGQGTDGEPSSILTVTADPGLGGGAAGGEDKTPARGIGKSGTIGSGGGTISNAGGTGTISNGAAGGAFATRAGGGGGAGASASVAEGGDGVSSSITGAAVMYGGGGGGAVHSGYTGQGVGGDGGGGNGSNAGDVTAATSGVDGKGGGGGGTAHNTTPGKGGSGIVIIRRTP